MQKFTSRRFIITLLAMCFNLLPLFQMSPEADRAILSVTIIAVVSLAGLNIEDWIYARKIFVATGNKAVVAALDANKPDEAGPPSPLVAMGAIYPILAVAIAYLIMRIGFVYA